MEEAYPHHQQAGSARPACPRSASASIAALAKASGNAPRRSGQGTSVFNLEAKIVRSRILNGEPRIDGRDTRTVRPIEIRTGVLPRTHGSALFTRGETQALVIATLGTGRDEQIIDAHRRRVRPSASCSTTTSRPSPPARPAASASTKRREAATARLAKRALVAMLPPPEEFPTPIAWSRITESNGSSSMASVCGGSLAMMDAGVPLKATSPASPWA